jgi:hypothetical protein
MGLAPGALLKALLDAASYACEEAA